MFAYKDRVRLSWPYLPDTSPWDYISIYGDDDIKPGLPHMDRIPSLCDLYIPYASSLSIGAPLMRPFYRIL